MELIVKEKKKKIIKQTYIQKIIFLFRHFTHIVLHNKICLKQELIKTKELCCLLYKSTKQVLTDIERIKIRNQGVDVLKAIPVLIIIALPFTFITLPTMIYLLPRNAFPSSFHQPIPPFLG